MLAQPGTLQPVAAARLKYTRDEGGSLLHPAGLPIQLSQRAGCGTAARGQLPDKHLQRIHVGRVSGRRRAPKGIVDSSVPLHALQGPQEAPPARRDQGGAHGNKNEGDERGLDEQISAVAEHGALVDHAEGKGDEAEGKAGVDDADLGGEEDGRQCGIVEGIDKRGEGLPLQLDHEQPGGGQTRDDA